MIHISCDGCGKPIRTGEDNHYMLKVELFAAHEPAPLTEDDLDEDHLDSVSQLLRDMEVSGESEALPPPSQQRRYDLCRACRDRFLRDPLNKETAQKFDFSEN